MVPPPPPPAPYYRYIGAVAVGLVDDSWCVRSSDGGQRDKRAHNSTTKFLRNYYTFVSLHDGDLEGVVRIFVAFPASYLH